MTENKAREWHVTFDRWLVDPVRYKLAIIDADDSELSGYAALNAEAAPTDKDREFISGLIDFEIAARDAIRNLIADTTRRLVEMDDRQLIANHSMATENVRLLREQDQFRDVTHIDARMNEAMIEVLGSEMAKRGLTLSEGNTPSTAS